MKKPVRDQVIPRSQLWFHHAEMQRRIRSAEADLDAGRFKVTHSAEEAQALLDSFKGKQGRGQG